MSLENLYSYHSFMETFKILKFYTPKSMHELLNFLPKNEKLSLMVPLVKLNVTQQNFVFKASKIWNDHKDSVFNKSLPSETGIIIPGSNKNSDLASAIGCIKKKLKDRLLSIQKLGDPTVW